MATEPLTRPYDDAFLRAYSAEHVSYEFDMFLWSARLSATGSRLLAPHAADVVRLNNALVQAFVVHLRNVIDFLYLKRPRATDVVAADFCPNGLWRVSLSSSLEMARIRANKEIAHLTTDRLAGAPIGRGWDFEGLRAEVQPVMRDFVAAAVPSRISPNVAAVTG